MFHLKPERVMNAWFFVFTRTQQLCLKFSFVNVFAHREGYFIIMREVLAWVTERFVPRTLALGSCVVRI